VTVSSSIDTKESHKLGVGYVLPECVSGTFSCWRTSRKRSAYRYTTSITFNVGFGHTWRIMRQSRDGGHNAVPQTRFRGGASQLGRGICANCLGCPPYQIQQRRAMYSRKGAGGGAEESFHSQAPRCRKEVPRENGILREEADPGSYGLERAERGTVSTAFSKSCGKLAASHRVLGY